MDYQMNANHSIFGRYLDTSSARPATLERTHNILAIRNIFGPKSRKQAQTTRVRRHAGVRREHRQRDSRDLRADVDAVQLAGGRIFRRPVARHPHLHLRPWSDGGQRDQRFAFSGGELGGWRSWTTGRIRFRTTARESGDGTRSSVGANVAYATLDSFDYANAAGNFAFNGSVTGIGAGRLLTGPGVHVDARDAEHPAQPSVVHRGCTCRTRGGRSNRLTLNLGLRWEPYFGTWSDNGAISNFSPDNFSKGVKSTQFRERAGRPPLPWRRGFPRGQHGVEQAVEELLAAPRRLAWDVSGDGRLAVRSSYAINYDYSDGDLPAGAGVRRPVRQSPRP